mgnify:CR=1 FL=1
MKNLKKEYLCDKITSYVRFFFTFRKGVNYVRKRKDSKGRVLRNGEVQRPDGKYMFRYTDSSVVVENDRLFTAGNW